MSKILYDYINSPISRFVNTREFKDSLAKVLCCTGGTGGGIQSIVAGTNVTIDNTDPLNPIISASGGGGGLTGSGTNNTLTKWTGTSSLGNSLVSEDGTTVKIGAVGSEPTFAFGVYGSTNGAVITGGEKALSLNAGNTSTVTAFTVLRSNTFANIAEFAAPSGALVSLTSSGAIQSSALAGTGTRVTLASSTGVLSALANGTDTHVLTLVAGTPTWAAAGGGGSGWGLTGNAVSSGDFLGTTNTQDLKFKVNNIQVANFATNDSITIGSGANASGIASISVGINSSNLGIAGISLGYQASNNAVNNGIALGRLTQVNHEGAFVSQDYSGSNALASLANHQWRTKFNGGYLFETGTTTPTVRLSILNTGQVGINTSTPAASAILEVTSTTQGVLFPRVTTTQKNAISTPATALEVYDSTLNSPQYYTGSAWASVWGSKGNLAASGDFIGTLNGEPLIFKQNNGRVGFFDSNLNISLGLQSHNSITTGTNNIALGYQSRLNPTGGDNNIAIGRLTLTNQVSGDSNIVIGAQAGSSQTAGSNNIIIGVSQQAASLTGSNQMNLGGIIFGAGLTGNSTTPAGQIAIGIATPQASALLDLNSTTKGLLLPRMSTTEINAIPSPAEGLTVFNITLHTLCFFDGTIWQKVTSTAM